MDGASQHGSTLNRREAIGQRDGYDSCVERGGWLRLLFLNRSVAQLGIVSKLSTVTVDKHRYSVPTRYSREKVRVEVFADKVEIYHKDELIAEHLRMYAKGEDSLLVEHYLPAIARKKRAVLHAAPVRVMSEIFGEVRKRLCGEGPSGYREFAKILLLLQEYRRESLEEALVRARCLPRIDAPPA